MNYEDKIIKLAKLIKNFTCEEEENREEIKKEIEYLTNSINNMQELITNSNKVIEKLNNKLQSIPKVNDITKEELQIRNIFKLHKVEDIEFNNCDNVFTLHTDYIIIKDDEDRKFQAGRYKIIVELDTYRVRFFCKDDEYRRRGYWGEGCQHPHVNQNGDPCLGNSSEMIVSAIEQKDLYLLSIILLGYLESVNVQDSAGRYISNWDMLDKEGNEIVDNYYKYERCGVCGEIIEGGDTYECECCSIIMCEQCSRETSGGYICEECVDEHDYVYCEQCGDYTPSHYTRELANWSDHYVCDGCIENYTFYKICDECGEVINTREDDYDVVDEIYYYCNNCNGEGNIYERCEECGEMFFNHNIRKINGSFYCLDCANDIEEDIETDEEDNENKEVEIKNYCDSCGRIIRVHEQEYVTEVGNIICEKCAEELNII